MGRQFVILVALETEFVEDARRKKTSYPAVATFI